MPRLTNKKITKKAAKDASKRAPKRSQHASDCAVHNEPAYPAGPCDCDASQAGMNRAFERAVNP